MFADFRILSPPSKILKPHNFVNTLSQKFKCTQVCSLCKVYSNHVMNNRQSTVAFEQMNSYCASENSRKPSMGTSRFLSTPNVCAL